MSYALFMNQKSDSATIKNAFSSVFDVPSEEIKVKFGKMDLEELDKNIKILIEISEMPDDFPICLSVILLQKNLIPLESDELNVISEICNKLSRSCLVPSGHKSPYVWIHIGDDFKKHHVYLNPYALDQKDYALKIDKWMSEI